MAFGRKLPQSFDEALQLAVRILSKNSKLVEDQLVTTESEQIVIAAYRKATGHALRRMDLFFRAKDRFPESAGEAVIILASGRAEGKILQHLIGYQAFLDHEYEVSPDVLVPRPETELLVAHAFEELSRQYGQPQLGLELGVGSGVIAIELLARFPGLEMFGSELTSRAEAIAFSNALRILNRNPADCARLRILRAQDPREVLQPFERGFSGKAQFLISNPPYLAAADEAESDVSRFEPSTALYGPSEDPSYFYREISRCAGKFLEPHAPVFLEIPHERAALIEGIFKIEGWNVRTLKDLNGRDRILSARL